MSPPAGTHAGHDHISPMAASLTAEAVIPPGFSQSHGAHSPKPTLSSPAADESQGLPSQPPPVPAKDGDGSSANHHYQHAHQSQQQTATGSPSASDSSKTPTAERADPFGVGALRMTHRKLADDGDGDAGRRRSGEQEANTAAWSRQQQQHQGLDGSQGRRNGAGLEIDTLSSQRGQGDNNGGADDDDDNVDGIAIPQPLSAISGRQQSIFEQLDSGSEARSSFDVPPEERGGSAAAPWTGSSSSMERSASGVRFSSAAAATAAAVMQSSPTSTSSLQAAASAGAGGSPSWRASTRNADSAGGQQGPARSNTVLTSSYLPSISGGSGSMDSYLSTSASTSSLASSYNNNNATQGSTSDAGAPVPPPLPTAPGVEEVVSPRGNPFDAFGRDGGEAEREGFYDQQQHHQRQAGEGGPRTQASRSAAAAAAAAAAGSRAQRSHGAQRGGVATDGHPNPEGEEMGHADAMEDDEGDEDEEDDDDALHPPIFTRSISSPLPSRVKHLRHPMITTGGGRRESHMSSSAGATRKSISANDVPHLSTSTASSGEPSPSDEAIVTPTALQTLSLELADSLQSAIQTLLHLSPPHLLDSAKEQYSGCTVQLPTTSLSALLTAMKGLNYLSANVAELCSDPSAVDQLPGGVIEPAPPARPGMGQQSSSSGNSAGSSHSGRGSARTSRHGSMTSTVAAPQIGSMETSLPAESFPPRAPLASSVHEDFDIGELLQSSADLLGGLAAQAGVDLVLFHGDVGIKHVSVKGDGEGLAYALSHVLRQIIAVCRWGDILELGLQIHQRPPASASQGVGQPHSYAMTPTHSAGSMPNGDESGRMSPGATMGAVASNAQDDQGQLYCSFEIIHNLISDSPRPEAVTPKPSDAAATFDEEPRHEPDFGGILSRRLLKHVNASLRVGSPKECTYFASGAFPGSRRSYTLSVQLPRGQGEVSDLTVEEEAARQPYPSVKLAKEPTLAELSTFAESLRTKKVDLHASLRSVFARHLTSYLAAWGMDISHFAIEDEVADAKLDTPGALAAATLDDKKADRLVIIDDDVNVLKKQLLRIRAETSLASLRPRNLQRPGLTTRARSSPHIRQIQQQSIEMPSSSSTVIHFTSLSRYNHVRDVVSSILAISPNAAARPEVVVIPKPVGPRRFLTALHTAISKPIIDPFFTPIATSPRSPGGSYFSPIPSRAPSSLEHPVSRAGLSGLAEEGSGSESHESIDRVLGTGQSGAMPIVTPSGELVATPAFEYFAGAAQKMGASAASGIMVQSPDGRPVGMFFEPPAKADRRASLGAKGDSSRRRSTARSSISSNGGGSKLAPPTSLQQSPASRRSASLSEIHPPEGKRGSQFNSVEEDDEGEDGSSGQPVKRSSTLRRKPTNPSTGSLPVAIGRDRASTITQIRGLEGLPGAATVPPSLASLRTNSRRSILQEAKAEAQARAQQQQEQQQKQQQTEAQQSKPRPTKKAAANKDSVVVPPINVLIVEDNPINQNILSMFLFKRKIKHQAANNGQEAVEKWRSGTFHLILMDIQLPVMDGIEATKEIRRLERSNNIGLFASTPTVEAGKMSPMGEEVPATPLRSSVIIVALTASSLQQDRVNALAAGCNDFLTKPVSLKWLENKIVEWGCMQALIDFEGWKRWKSVDRQAGGAGGAGGSGSANEAKRNMTTSSNAKARAIADRLKIAPNKPVRNSSFTPPPPPPTSHKDAGPQIAIQQPTPDTVDHQPDIVHTTLPNNPDHTVAPELGITGAQALEQGISVAQDELDDNEAKANRQGPDAATPDAAAANATPMAQLAAGVSTIQLSSSEESHEITPQNGDKPARRRPSKEVTPTASDRPQAHEPDAFDAPNAIAQQPGPPMRPPEFSAKHSFNEPGHPDSGPQPDSNPSSESTPDSGQTGSSAERDASPPNEKPLPPLPEEK